MNVTEAEGYNITLTCNAFGNPEPNVSWTVIGPRMDISNNHRISFSQDKKKMIITNVARTDSGQYRCMATNSLGDATSHVATLDVQCKLILRRYFFCSSLKQLELLERETEKVSVKFHNKIVEND